jgi:hypothetical protein
MPPQYNVFRFGPFEFKPQNGHLSKNGYRIKLQPKSAAILKTLLDSPGQIILREQIQMKLWSPGIHVNFALGIKVAVKKLRDALGDSAGAQRASVFVRTYHKRIDPLNGKLTILFLNGVLPNSVPLLFGELFSTLLYDGIAIDPGSPKMRRSLERHLRIYFRYSRS